MTKVPNALIVLALAATACSQPASEQTSAPAPAATPAPAAATRVPEDIAEVVTAAAPGIAITGGEEGGDEYEVTGRMPNGDEVELDVVRTNGAWSVLEIQRDVPWASVPEPVRTAAAAAPNAFEPVRVIESRMAADGSIVYELFTAAGRDGAPARGPAMEVRWHEGKAEIVPRPQ